MSRIKKIEDIEYFRLKVPILNDEYYVYILVGNIKKSVRFLVSYFEDKTITEEDFENKRGKTWFQNGCQPVIWIGIHDHFMSTLSHEAVHAINFIWEYVGEQNKDEVYANAVGAVVNGVEKLFKHGKS